MLLLTGPLGSGKTHRVLQEVRARLKTGRGDFRLLAPTAGMAEHFRNLLAREGFVFHPKLVSTLFQFVEAGAGNLRPVSDAALDALIRNALARLAPAEYRAVATLPGFRAVLARSIGELSAAGGEARHLAHAPALQAIFADVANAVAQRGMALGGVRMGSAAESIRCVFLDGFFSFSDPELDVIDALHLHRDLTVTLPSWPGAEASLARLLSMGFDEVCLDEARPKPEVVLIQARTRERELDEIAARVLDQAQAGRPFREIGIVVRSADPYVPALRFTFERFGIPARFHFSSPLADHSLVRRLTTLPQLNSWRAQTATPPEWAVRFISLLEAPEPSQPPTHEMALLWRAGAAALRGIEKAAEETASLFPQEEHISFEAFFDELKTVLRLTALRVPDRRRNVVHVMDPYEARHLELPVVFVCGLLEKQFPQYPPQDPILTEKSRLRLRQQGIRVANAAERDQTERFLFDLATTRATETLVLSYPEFNAKGDANLRSFYLDRFLEGGRKVRVEAARAVRPRPFGARPPERRPVILDEELRQWLAQRHAALGPTAIESFLQCPFQFFATRSLKLEEPSVEPQKRLDPRVEGEIVHAVLERWLRQRQPMETLLEDVFREACLREGIPDGYRTEAVRLELLRDLLRFIGRVMIPGARLADAERSLKLVLGDGVTLHCRVDRIDTTSDGRALIVDYKYSTPDNVAKLVSGHDRGTRIQGGIYMLAVKDLGRELCGMLFAGLRKEPVWDGWHTLAGSVGRAQRCEPQVLHEVMEQSRQTALDAVARIRQGVIAPQPADLNICQYCSCRDICRVESAAGVAAAGEVEE